MIDPERPDFSDTPAAATRATFAYAPADPAADPLVTILTPFYNTGAVFRDTVRCVLRQSLQQWEWVIVNDGTTSPESLALLEEVRASDPRIRVIDMPANAGPSAARNTGFAAARSEYVLQLDSDDLLEPTAAEKCWWFLESHPEYAFVKGYSVGFGSQQYLSTHGFHDGARFLEQNITSVTAMIRRSTHARVGGYDASNRAGLEDWQFWLGCAAAQQWGGTIPEFLDWYRRRDNHAESWANWDGGPAQEAFLRRMRQAYPELWNGGFPSITPRHHPPNAPLTHAVPGANPLRKDAPRLLMILPWLTMGGADRFNLDVVRQLSARGWEITIATTLTGDHSWLPLFTGVTPDVFALHRFLPLTEYARFLRYLMESRRPDLVMVSNSELGYLLLPYLRACAPETTFVDYTHMEEEHWKSGGYPRMAVEYQGFLDANITSSHHLKQWMVSRGADTDRTVVCHTGVDVPAADLIEAQRRAKRAELAVAPDHPVILYAGRLCQQKQPKVFADTMRRLAVDNLPYTAIVAGAGPDFEMLSTFVVQHQLESRVRFVGAVPPPVMYELIAAADIFFLPSEWEGIALAIHEAMAHGRAIVGADVGGQRELVTPECGVLISRGGGVDAEAERYAAVLAPLLTDQRMRRDMGRRSRQRIEANYQVDTFGERLLAALTFARRLHETAPRPPVTEHFARVAATNAIEYLRLHRVADELWMARYQMLGASQHIAVPPVTGLRRRVFRACSILEPAYAWGIRRGWHWLPALRQRMRDAVAGV